MIETSNPTSEVLPRPGVKTVQKAVFTVLGIAAVVALLAAGFVGYFYWTAIRPLKVHIHDVRWKSPISDVRAGLDELWRKHQTGPMESASIDVHDSSMAPALSALEPHWVGVSAGQVRFELGGAECHYGFELVTAPDAITSRETKFREFFPSEEVSPGLWFYAEWGLPPR